MAFSIGLNFITGMMLGIEFSVDEDAENNPSRYVVVDLFILRVVMGFHPEV